MQFCISSCHWQMWKTKGTNLPHIWVILFCICLSNISSIAGHILTKPAWMMCLYYTITVSESPNYLSKVGAIIKGQTCLPLLALRVITQTLSLMTPYTPSYSWEPTVSNQSLLERDLPGSDRLNQHCVNLLGLECNGCSHSQKRPRCQLQYQYCVCSQMVLFLIDQGVTEVCPQISSNNGGCTEKWCILILWLARVWDEDETFKIISSLIPTAWPNWRG